MKWSEKNSLRRWYLTEKIKEERENIMWLSGGWDFRQRPQQVSWDVIINRLHKAWEGDNFILSLLQECLLARCNTFRILTLFSSLPEDGWKGDNLCALVRQFPWSQQAILTTALLLHLSSKALSFLIFISAKLKPLSMPNARLTFSRRPLKFTSPLISVLKINFTPF